MMSPSEDLVAARGEPAVDEARADARRRVQARHDLLGHAVTFVVFNTFLVVVWVVLGGDFFWPIWVIAPWAAALVLHAWDVLLRHPVTEADVDAELQRTVRARR